MCLHSCTLSCQPCTISSLQSIWALCLMDTPIVWFMQCTWPEASEHCALYLWSASTLFLKSKSHGGPGLNPVHTCWHVSGHVSTPGWVSRLGPERSTRNVLAKSLTSETYLPVPKTGSQSFTDWTKFMTRAANHFRYGCSTDIFESDALQYTRCSRRFISGSG